MSRPAEFCARLYLLRAFDHRPQEGPVELHSQSEPEPKWFDGVLSHWPEATPPPVAALSQATKHSASCTARGCAKQASGAQPVLAVPEPGTGSTVEVFIYVHLYTDVVIVETVWIQLNTSPLQQLLLCCPI